MVWGYCHDKHRDFEKRCPHLRAKSAAAVQLARSLANPHTCVAEGEPRRMGGRRPRTLVSERSASTPLPGSASTSVYRTIGFASRGASLCTPILYRSLQLHPNSSLGALSSYSDECDDTYSAFSVYLSGALIAIRQTFNSKSSLDFRRLNYNGAA